MKLIPTISFKKDENIKTCGTCTKCCEGWINANIEGHSVYPGNPCYFLQEGSGCTRYDTRPYFPCKNYQCGWLIFKDIPDKWKPENCGVIMTVLDLHDEKYINFQNAPLIPSIEMVEWAKEYFSKKEMNFLYVDRRGIHPFGTKSFIRSVREHKNGFSIRKFPQSVVDKYNLDPDIYLDKD